MVSRGHGRTERFILAYLAAGHTPAIPSLGFSARELAGVLAGTAGPTRSAVSSAGRAMSRLAEDGQLVLVTPSMRRRAANTFARRANGS
jgi:hypothetical protein